MTTYKRKRDGKMKHPLYPVWASMRVRSRRDPHGYLDCWNDFWQFTKDVGSKPDRMVFYRLRRDEPYGPTNFQWVPRRVCLVRNLGVERAQRIMGGQRTAIKAKVAGMNCAKSQSIFNGIKRKSVVQ